MNNDPLQRRMFAQQIMAQHARANQPMGILASSPQLMGAVQGFKDGGEVKGYQAGGLEAARSLANQFNERGFSVLAVPSILKQHPNITYSKDLKQFVPKTDRNDLPAEYNMTTTSNLENLKNKSLIRKEGEFGGSSAVVKENTNNPVQEAETFSLGEKPTLQGVDGYGNKINDKTQSLLNNITKFPLGKNQGAEITDKTDEIFVPDAENPYKGLDKKYATRLKNANKLFDKATNDPKVTNEWKEKVEEIYNKKGTIDLEKIDKLAKEGAGIGDDNYDKRRSTAFWMGLIKGGLATAAGESSNALTNIAKGLSFGVESFGKDINAIDEDEREDRKEYGKLKVDLIKNEESKQLAHKSLELQYASKMYEINQNQNNFESKMEFEKAKAKIDNELRFEAIEISKADAWNKIQWQEKGYKLQLKEFKLNKQKQVDYVRLTEESLKNAWNKNLLTDDMKEVIAMGPEYINVNKETGMFESFTEIGKKALVTSKLTGHKITDLNTVANGHVTLGNVLGVKYLKEDGSIDEKRTKAAAFVWQENFADKWQKIQIKKGSGGFDLNKTIAEENRLLELFADRSNGIYSTSNNPPNKKVIKKFKKLEN